MQTKQKTCKWCKTKFTPDRPRQVCHAGECEESYAIKHASRAEANRAREDRKTIKLKLDKLKTLSDYIKETQIAVNSYVRERDKGKACISCGSMLGSGDVGGAFDAGHFRSRGSSPHLRFDAERNIHGQCKRCNRYLSGNYSDYRSGLVSRIGLESVEKLEADNEPRKYTIEELKAIKCEYVAKLKEIKNENSK